MEYEELKLLKQSGKGTVHLICSEGNRYVRKVLAGCHPVYELLRDNPHPGIPKLEEVAILEDSTVVIEEYVEGESISAADLSKKQFRQSCALFWISCTEKELSIAISSHPISFWAKTDMCA